MIKVVFKLAYRQTHGFAGSLLKLMDLSGLKVPSYTQLCRRAATLEVAPYQIPQNGSIVIAIDSTGLKIYGEGEWKKEIGYHRRNLSETAMFRYKTIHGNKLYSRIFDKQKIENNIKIKTLNIMTAQGMPISKSIKVA